MTDQASVSRAAERNAGIGGEFPPGTSFDERLKFNTPSVTPLSYVRSVYETNVFGVMAVTQAMLPLLREAPAGRIVNVGSSSGALTLNTNPEFQQRNVFGAAYSPAKAARKCDHGCVCNRVRKDKHQGERGLPGYVAT